MKNLKYILSGIFLLAIATVALANPGIFGSSAQTSTATTTPVYLVIGTAIATTTGPVYDSYEVNGTNQTNQGQVNSPNTAALLIQFTASSTGSVLGWSYEFSQDGVDWYADNYVDVGRLSTSSTVNISTPITQTWTFASSTVGGVGANGNVSNKLVTIPVPTRYVRPVFYITSTSRGAVWAQFVPKKELK